MVSTPNGRNKKNKYVKNRVNVPTLTGRHFVVISMAIT